MRNDIYLKQMGSRISAIRKAKKITLDQMSELSGIDVSNISILENGRRNAHILTLKVIADVLKVDAREFL